MSSETASALVTTAPKEAPNAAHDHDESLPTDDENLAMDEKSPRKPPRKNLITKIFTASRKPDTKKRLTSPTRPVISTEEEDNEQGQNIEAVSVETLREETGAAATGISSEDESEPGDPQATIAAQKREEVEQIADQVVDGIAQSFADILNQLLLLDDGFIGPNLTDTVTEYGQLLKNVVTGRPTGPDASAPGNENGTTTEVLSAEAEFSPDEKKPVERSVEKSDWNYDSTLLAMHYYI